MLRKKNQSRHQTLFIPKGSGTIKKTIKGGEHDLVTKFEFGSQLYKGKLLAPFIFVVLNANCFICSTCKDVV